MPEGDTVFHAAAQLRGVLAGRPLTRSDFRVPRFAVTDLAGHAVTESVARGKHLLIRTDRGLTVHTHLKMEGRWRIAPASERLRESYRIRLILANEEWRAVGYQLGIVEVLPTSEEERVTGHLGPDLLGPDWDQAEAVRRLRADPDRSAGEALLDQRNLAGIGNVYKSEVLFLRGIRPWRPVGTINDVDALVSLSHRMLQANKERAHRVTTGDQRRGYETWVYGRRGRPCRRCGTRIRCAELGDRVTYWCPSCQPD
jgi:endonuclease VIII